jgi:rhamnosyltransferase
MKISVIILTLNAEKNLALLLEKLSEQTTKPFEILCIDSSSKDNSVTIAKKHGAKTIVIPKSDFGHGKTRNLGAQKSTGDILLYMVQDAMPYDKYLIEKLVSPLDDKIVASYARQMPRENAFPTEKFARLFNYPENPIVKSQETLQQLGVKNFFFSDVCSAIRKKEFLEVHGFSDSAIANEDFLVAVRLINQGYKISYVPEAKVIHSHNYNYSQQFKRYFDIGTSFNMNKEITGNIKNESEGKTFVKAQISFLWNNKKTYWIPYAIGEAIFKFMGYKLGLKQHLIPRWIKRRLSMHSYYWA